MALDVDGLAVLRSIANHASTFPDVVTEAAKVARALVTKQIKGKATTLNKLRDVRKAIGGDAFNLILDGFPDAQITTLVTKFDENHPDLKTSNPQWRRRQLGALADGSAEPAAKPKASTKQKASKKAVSTPSTTPERLDYRSAGAIRKR
jgi:hypothetical protein